MYKIKEIFGPTIQGEGSETGTAVLFLRFAGCNRWTGKEADKAKSICSFCDTDFVGGSFMTPIQIVEALNKQSRQVRTVVISGGEPLLQLDLELVEALTANGFRLHLETNGSKPLGRMAPYFDHVSMSPKQSREKTKLEKATNIKILFPYISSEISLEEFKSFPADSFYIQPVWGSDYNEVFNLIYEHAPTLKLSAQMHKYLEVL